MGALPRYFEHVGNTCVNVNSVCPVSVGSTAPRTTGRPGPEMFIQRLLTERVSCPWLRFDVLTEVFSSCVNVNEAQRHPPWHREAPPTWSASKGR